MANAPRRVAIVAAEHTTNPGIYHPEITFKEMIAESAYRAIKRIDLDPKMIQGLSYGYHGEGVSEYGGLGPTISDALGLSPAPCFITASNCTSGSVSFQMGVQMIESGRYDIVLCGGFEKPSDHLNYTDYINASTETEYDYLMGISHVDAFHLANEAYFHYYGYSADDTAEVLARFGLQMRRYGQQCPDSFYYQKSLPSVEHLKSLPEHGAMLAPGEASGSVILVAEELAHRYTDKPVFVKGMAYTNTSHYFGSRYNRTAVRGIDHASASGMVSPANAIACTTAAYQDAGITAEDVDVIQVYDEQAAGLIQMETLGICPAGEAGRWVLDDQIGPDGRCPVNTDGGNIGRGHASGCDGIMHIAELFRQLRGESANQVSHARIAVSSNIGGYMAHNSVIVLCNE
ncbi:acetyl-CoA acetyltransferase [Vibrio aerogenes CECT 7868]|uniref:Acetyl-CoA acetyltransferase n=1 Tax=Vibrio aerogenes CECT 7868 TaxID=1216006 RepID=A0A1M5ZBV5_9VIBR|nr:thiolase family protein [Vibrio aerogenes]SHI21727.1 acetyl-CoA acetyltransferase [Vibrio aerogenes CECT 7868]